MLPQLEEQIRRASLLAMEEELQVEAEGGGLSVALAAPERTRLLGSNGSQEGRGSQGVDSMAMKRPRRTRRGGGFGISGKAKDFVHVIFANVTSGSDAVVGWLNECSHDIVCLAEVHHRGSKLQAFAKDVSSTGRWVIATEADPSGRSLEGTTGGVALLPKGTLEVTLLNSSVQKLGCWSSKEDNAFLTGLQLNLRKGLQI